ncbi:serine hydrolase [Saccharopolyspora cebuensis]|uniref:Serine hydrolase n=1 Tax=Saccharopolyspora cebuensis TaxID=418759 RepID=A0ABV4CFL4_9PSEU
MGFAERLRASGCWDDLPGRVGVAAWDLDEREPVLLGAERAVHPASTIKVLVLVAALRAVRDGALDLDTRVPLPERRAGGSGVLPELPSVGELPLAELLALMVVVSDNTATNAVLDAVGFAAVADCADRLGCRATRLERRLMDERAPGRVQSCALDLARVLDALVTGAALPPELTRHALAVLSRQQVRDRLPALLPAGAGCWNKPGELLGVRHDVGLIGTADRPRAVVAVLVDELADERSATTTSGGPATAAIARIGAAAHRALEPANG